MLFRSAVPDMLYIGSGAVYGRRTTPEPISEDDPIAPDPMDVGLTLGHAKRAAEHFCAIYGARGVTRIKIARCFSFVGPQLPLDIHYAIGNFIADAIAGRPITVTGTGLPVRSYMYMSDLVVWLITILLRGQPLRPYNVGSQDGRTVLEVADIVAAVGSQSVPDIEPRRIHTAIRPATITYPPRPGRCGNWVFNWPHRSRTPFAKRWPTTSLWS